LLPTVGGVATTRVDGDAVTGSGAELPPIFLSLIWGVSHTINDENISKKPIFA
jgi:hypothetical protein